MNYKEFREQYKSDCESKGTKFSMKELNQLWKEHKNNADEVEVSKATENSIEVHETNEKLVVEQQDKTEISLDEEYNNMFNSDVENSTNEQESTVNDVETQRLIADLVDGGLEIGLNTFVYKKAKVTKEQITNTKFGQYSAETILYYFPNLELSHPLFKVAMSGFFLGKVISDKLKEDITLIEKEGDKSEQQSV